MLVVLTTDLYLVNWPDENAPPPAGEAIDTDHGAKTVLRVLRDDAFEGGVPKWAGALRASLS